MTYEELKTWAAALTDEQLTQALYELRDRGSSVACYNAGEFEAMFDGDLREDFDGEAWMDEHRDDLEEVMCEAARQYFIREAAEAFDDE
ncbi:hypothetical protein [Mesorhizobium sp. WSM2239]|uniref:Uncharacterized protein n=2 Tax=unclassified Mesorhizobium TaxID=325217 RepID=A0AAU8DH39_9HYPH